MILGIETSTTNCSVGVFDTQGIILGCESYNDGYSHAERLGPMVQQLFRELSIESGQLTALAVGDGPGSYTGLRIGASFIKGMAYALEVPVYTVCSLENMYSQCTSMDANTYLPMIDARRMEVYTRSFGSDILPNPTAQIIDETTLCDVEGKVLYMGTGAEKCIPVFEKRSNWEYLPAIMPSVEGMVKPVLRKMKSSEKADVAYFEPNYIKSFTPGKRKRWF